MYRPNYINTTPIRQVDVAIPYSNGLVLTRAAHQQNVSADNFRWYYRLSDTVYEQSVSVSDWMRCDHIDGGHVILLGAMLRSPEMDAGGDFTTAYLRNVSFSGLLHTNTTALVDKLHMFTWTAVTPTAVSNNAGLSSVGNYNILSCGGRQCDVDKSFILTEDNLAVTPHPYALAVGFGIFNPTTTVADAVDVKFTLNANQHLHERPCFDPSR